MPACLCLCPRHRVPVLCALLLVLSGLGACYLRARNSSLSNLSISWPRVSQNFYMVQIKHYPRLCQPNLVRKARGQRLNLLKTPLNTNTTRTSQNFQSGELPSLLGRLAGCFGLCLEASYWLMAASGRIIEIYTLMGRSSQIYSAARKTNI